MDYFFEGCAQFCFSGVSSSFVESRGVPDGSGGKSIPVASICKCVDVLLVRIIMQT